MHADATARPRYGRKLERHDALLEPEISLTSTLPSIDGVAVDRVRLDVMRPDTDRVRAVGDRCQAAADVHSSPPCMTMRSPRLVMSAVLIGGSENTRAASRLSGRR